MVFEFEFDYNRERLLDTLVDAGQLVGRRCCLLDCILADRLVLHLPAYQLVCPLAFMATVDLHSNSRTLAELTSSRYAVASS